MGVAANYLVNIIIMVPNEDQMRWVWSHITWVQLVGIHNPALHNYKRPSFSTRVSTGIV